jgi:hypothetical protein
VEDVALAPALEDVLLEGGEGLVRIDRVVPGHEAPDSATLDRPAVTSRLPLALLVLVLAGSSSASAAVRVSVDPPDEGPVIAGKRVAWGFAVRTRDGNRLTGALRVKSAVPGRRARVIWRGQTAAQSAGGSLGSLSASASAVTFVESGLDSSAIWVAEPDGRARLLERLVAPDPCGPRITAADTSGSTVTYAVRGCEVARVVIRPARPGSAARSMDVSGTDLRAIALAGRYLAWSASLPPFPPLGFPGRDEVVVIDHVDGREVYRADVTSVNGGLSPGSPFQFDLQRDGKLVVAYSGRPAGVAWFGIDGRPRVVRSGVGASDPVLARDVIAVRLARPTASGEIALLDLTGRRLRVLHRFSGPFANGSIGWSGRLAAWARHGEGAPGIFAERVR